MDPKEEKFKKISNHVLQVLASRGLDAVRVTSVASKVGISRAWIYKYIAKNTEELIDFALQDFERDFGSLGDTAFLHLDPKDKMSFTKALSKNTWLMVEYSKQHPLMMQLISRYLNSKNRVGEKVDQMSETHIRRMTQMISETYERPVDRAYSLSKTLLAIRMGLMFQYSRQDTEITEKEFYENLALIFNRFLVTFSSEVELPKS